MTEKRRKSGRARERERGKGGGKTDVSLPAEHCCLAQKVLLPRGDKKESAVYLR